MQVKEIMTFDPACCTPDNSLASVARMMQAYDCGAIPVVRSKEDLTPIGIITDRDIVCRVLAEGKNPIEMKSSECMTADLVIVEESADVDDALNLMEEHQIRRLIVVDEEGQCCGIIAQADIAETLSEHDTAEVVREISQPAHSPS